MLKFEITFRYCFVFSWVNLAEPIGQFLSPMLLMDAMRVTAANFIKVYARDYYFISLFHTCDISPVLLYHPLRTNRIFFQFVLPAFGISEKTNLYLYEKKNHGLGDGISGSHTSKVLFPGLIPTHIKLFRISENYNTERSKTPNSSNPLIASTFSAPGYLWLSEFGYIFYPSHYSYC